MKKLLFLVFVVANSVLFAKPVVTTSILPTKYFIEQIAGDSIEVNVMVQKGADPHTYEPKPKQMKKIEKSDIYFAVGVEFEETWLDKFTKNYPKMAVVNTQEGIEKIEMKDEHEEHHHQHKHEHGHHEHKHEAHHHDHAHHHHDGLDPHIWLDPELVKIQAKNIAEALVKKYPAQAKEYMANLEKFTQKLTELDKFISKELSNAKNREFIVYHPSWGYFAKRYNLEQIAIEIEGKEPKPADLAELIEEAKEHGVKVIFVAPQFSQKAAKTIAKQTGAMIKEADPLSYDWENEIKRFTKILAK